MAAAVGTTTQSEHFNSDGCENEENVSKTDQSSTDVENVEQSANADDKQELDTKGEKDSLVKKFDNKNFVEAPIPKTNPWNKGKTAKKPEPVITKKPEPPKPTEVAVKPKVIRANPPTVAAIVKGQIDGKNKEM